MGARAVPYTAAPTSQPGGVIHSIRQLEYVRASRYAAMGQIGSGLQRRLRGTRSAVLVPGGALRDSPGLAAGRTKLTPSTNSRRHRSHCPASSRGIFYRLLGPQGR